MISLSRWAGDMPQVAGCKQIQPVQVSDQLFAVLTLCITEKLDMRHSGKLFRRERLRDQARCSASTIEGGACQTLQYVNMDRS